MFYLKIKKMRRVITFLIAISIILFYLLGCKSLTKSQKGAMIGAGAGGAVGAGIGKAAGNTALGAILGASVGGVAGGIIGKQMDKQAKEIEQIPGAQVQRVGEGINVTFDSGVLFDTDKSNLASSSKTKLADLAGILNNYPETYILIEGHTDAAGSNAHNKTLSRKRAESVADYLAGLNIKNNRIRVDWYGEEQPKFPNDSPENMAKNRRVEFAIYANEQLVDKAQKEAGGK
jgi:outer membrane protein OmpA-like peptidoglycan-associated protein